MPTVLSVLTAATPAPSPENTLRPGLDPSQVSPGLIGFLMTFVLTAAVVLLVIDFNRRNRRLRYRAQYAEQRVAQEQQGGPGTQSPGSEPSGRSERGTGQGATSARPTAAPRGNASTAQDGPDDVVRPPRAGREPGEPGDTAR
ncbi:hypothetical protein [Kocuria sp.]|uniref:hypothetical protein n=1 Tax=Kocuria sp. TaxID=1871328 RepID=UPI0026DCD58A|nr:hypothetical protein [Kocuria sp.]MDO4919357.1 hypothetical protein [Kocuria sp.]